MARWGILVYVVQPGFTVTEMNEKYDVTEEIRPAAYESGGATRPRPPAAPPRLADEAGRS